MNEAGTATSGEAPMSPCCSELANALAGSQVSCNTLDENSKQQDEDVHMSTHSTQSLQSQQQQQQQQQQQEQDKSLTPHSSSSMSTTSSTTSASTAGSKTNGTTTSGSGTHTHSKFKDKRPEPLKLSANLNQEIPLDLSVKSAGNMPSGMTLSNIFNLTSAAHLASIMAGGSGGGGSASASLCSSVAAAAAAVAAANATKCATTLETPRITWQDNDMLLMKPRLFSSSTSTSAATPSQVHARSHRLSSSLAGDSSPVLSTSTNNTSAAFLDLLCQSPATSSSVHAQSGSAFALQSALAGQQSPLHRAFAPHPAKLHRHQSQQQQQQQQNLAQNIHSSSGYLHLAAQHHNQLLQQQQQQQQLQLQLQLSPLSSRLLYAQHHLMLAERNAAAAEAATTGPRRSCSSDSLAARPAASKTHLIPIVSPSKKQNSISPLATKSFTPALHSPAAAAASSSRHDLQFSYSTQQIAAVAGADTGTSSSLAGVGVGSTATIDTPVATTETKALTPTSVANATANLLNIRLNSPGNEPQSDPMLCSTSIATSTPSSSSSLCTTSAALSYLHSHTTQERMQAMAAAAAMHGRQSSSLNSNSATLNTPTLISPSIGKTSGSSLCFLPSPTLSPMSSVFELPSPLLMFPPPPQASGGGGGQTQPGEQTSGNNNKLAVGGQANMRATHSDVQLAQPVCDSLQAAAPASLSAGDLAHLVTCARDKVGVERAGDDDAFVSASCDNIVDDMDVDAGSNIDNISPSTTAVMSKSSCVSARCEHVANNDNLTGSERHQNNNGNDNNAIPRILVSATEQRQQRQQQELQKQSNFLPSSFGDLHRCQRLESSSAPPGEVYAKDGVSRSEGFLPQLDSSSCVVAQNSLRQSGQQQQQLLHPSADISVAQCVSSQYSASTSAIADVAASDFALGAQVAGGVLARPHSVQGQLHVQQQHNRMQQSYETSSGNLLTLNNCYNSSTCGPQRSAAGFSTALNVRQSSHVRAAPYPSCVQRPGSAEQLSLCDRTHTSIASLANREPYNSFASAHSLAANSCGNVACNAEQRAPTSNRPNYAPTFASQDYAQQQQQQQVCGGGGYYTNPPSSSSYIPPPPQQQQQQQQQHNTRLHNSQTYVTQAFSSSSSSSSNTHKYTNAVLQPHPQQQPRATSADAYYASNAQHHGRTGGGSDMVAAVAVAAAAAAACGALRSQSATPNAGAKKYHCDECTKSFTRSDMLTRHKRLHSGDRPFQCNECKQEFSRSDHLSTHMRTHTGEKPYRCKLCTYSACRKDMITRHMKVHNRTSPK